MIPKPAGADIDLESGTGAMEADATAGGVMGIRDGLSSWNPRRGFEQKGRRASSPSAPSMQCIVATARARVRAASGRAGLGFRIVSEGPEEAVDATESGDPRSGVCMGDVAGEMGAKACRTRRVLSDGSEAECERDEARVLAPLSAPPPMEPLLLAADAQRRLLQRWPEW